MTLPKWGHAHIKLYTHVSTLWTPKAAATLYVPLQAKLDHTVSVAKDTLMVLLFMAAVPPETAYVDVLSLAAIYYLQRKPGP